MKIRSFALGCCLLLIPTTKAFAQAGDALTIDREPVLRVTAGGPTALVTALAFSANGQALYAGGYDKVLHAWVLNAQQQFVPSANAYRVPIGPGIDGAINSVTLSPDGAWLAAAGRGMLQHGGVAGFRQTGIWVPTLHGMSNAMWEDQGAIQVFDTRAGTAQQLRGHRGPVLALAFAPRAGQAPPYLASIAREYNGKSWTGVVRLWDVAQGKELARRVDLPDPIVGGRVLAPRLAVWTTGVQPRRAHVAIAGDDGTLRLWNAEGGDDKLWSKADGDLNNTVAYLATPDRLLTASIATGSGVLKLWNAPAGQAPEVFRQATLPRGHEPRALALFASEAGGKANRAAVVAAAPDKLEKVAYLLSVYDLADLKPIGEPLRLWGGALMTPSLAVTPDSRFLAAAGNKEHEVHVFATTDLAKNQDNRQRLRGSGATIAHSAFVKNGPNLGLLLSETPRPGNAKPQAGDVIFDFGRRSLTGEQAGWQLDTPAADGWEVKETTVKNEQGRDAAVLTVVHNQKTLGTVRLKPGALWVSHALLPAAPQQLPLLAVAYTELGQTMLGLYDARSGEQFRQLVGHVNRIRSLAFSGDGRLLVSAGDDQIVCVWHLTDTAKVLGFRGLLRGLTVSFKDKELTLDDIDSSSITEANRKALEKARVQSGDVIEGFVNQGKLRPVKSLFEYYDGIFVVKPGQPVTLRVRQRGDVTLTNGQGTDEHKPLFSLFVTRGSRAADRRWIGWSPIGPYDASDVEAKRLLGWHQNTGDPRRPVIFSLAQEQRDDVNYKEDILKYLVAQAHLGRAIEAWNKDHPDKVREPKMSLWINEPGLNPERVDRGKVLVRQLPGKLFLSIHELPLGKPQTVRWEVDGKQRGEFAVDPTDDREWSADLSRLDWKRGDHTIRVTLKTAVPETQEYPRTLNLNYQPPRPLVKAGSLPRVVDKADYRLQAEVAPGEGQAAQVRVVHRHNGKDLIDDKPIEIKTADKIDRTLKLQPGLNQVRIIVRNRDADPTDEAEADFLTLDVQYKTARPSITLAEAVPQPGGTRLRVDPDRPDRPIRVDAAQVRLVGEIESLDELSAASWVTGEAAKGEKRQPLAAAKQKRYAIDQVVTVPEPGKPYKVRFQAKTAASEETERFVILQYEPRLPELRVTNPVDGQPVIEGKDTLPIRIEGRLLWPDDRHPCTAQLLVNDKVHGPQVALDGKATLFTAQAVLQPGENRIAVRLTNSWSEETSGAVSVNFRRPPRVVSITGPAKADKPFADVVAQVASARNLPLTHVRIKDSELLATEVKPEAVRQDGEVTVYRMEFKQLPLQPGTNRIEFLASNADGWALKPEVLTIELTQRLEPRAEVDFLMPQQDTVVESAPFTTEFAVRSRSPLTRIELRRGGMALFHRTDFADVKKTSDGWFAVRVTQPLTLLPGPNPLQVIAHNAGGEQVSPALIVTYRTAPVMVRIDALVVAGTSMSPVLLVGDDTPLFQAAEDRVSVLGHVEWEPQSDVQMAKITHVRVSVNGFQQPPAVLETKAKDRRSRTFQAEVRLTRAEGNRISVKLPDFPQEQHSRTQCLVNCAHPGVKAEPRRQAHLLIVDTAKNEDEKAIVQRVYQGLQAEATGENRFKKPGCTDGGRLYGPLVGEDVTPEKVYMQLLIIKRSLRKRAEAGAVNDVVFLYFRGGETIDAQGHFFRTSDSERDPELRWSGIPCDYLNRFFAENLGAQFVLLDVTRDQPASPAAPPQRGKDRVAQWPTDPYVTVIRYAWNGPPQAQPELARLLTDWTDGTRQAPTLKGVLKTMAARFSPGPSGGQESIRFQSRLTYFAQAPPALEDFPITSP